MIRLTVEQLYALQNSIELGGEVNATILPKEALQTERLVVAWAKGRANGEEYYLSLWKDADSWRIAKQKDEAGLELPYDPEEKGSEEYSHTYPVGIQGSIVHAMRLDSNGNPTGIMSIVQKAIGDEQD